MQGMEHLSCNKSSEETVFQCSIGRAEVGPLRNRIMILVVHYYRRRKLRIQTYYEDSVV